MHIWLDNRLNADMEASGKVLGRLLFEMIEVRLELSVCGGEAHTGFELDQRK